MEPNNTKGFWKSYMDYIHDNPHGYWFKRKWYGWGWTPVTRQGWALTLGYLLLVLAFALTIDESSPVREIMFTYILPIVLLTITFIIIAYKKGEPPRWQWGKRKE